MTHAVYKYICLSVIITLSERDSSPFLLVIGIRSLYTVLDFTGTFSSKSIAYFDHVPSVRPSPPLSLFLLCLLSHSTQDYLPRGGGGTAPKETPTPITNRENTSIALPTGQSGGGIFSVEVRSLQLVSNL